MQKLLDNDKIHNQYLLIGDEPLLIDKAVESIKKALKVNESFDYDTFVVSETAIEDIMSKLYITPFASKRRIVVVKNLEELDSNMLASFAETINSTTSQNCLIMTYRSKKDNRKTDAVNKKIVDLFEKAHYITFHPDKKRIRKWIASKIRRDNLNLSPSIITYLEDEFNNDITGLKNEFEKIENYLREAKTLDTDGVKDLAQGLCDFNKYQMVDTFLNGGRDTIRRFEELSPYLRSYAEIVYALTTALIYHTKRKRNAFEQKTIANILDEISEIDRNIKRSSYFANLRLELFFLKNAPLFKKGAIYGRQQRRVKGD